MSNAPFWDERFRRPEYAYGKMPNVFFYEQLQKLTPGKLLLPCEGEGRNAVAAAKLGWDVVAFDISAAGRDKAMTLAKENNVAIDYRIGEIDRVDLASDSFDAVGLVFAHMPPALRASFHEKVAGLLKPGGWLILEAFHVKQLGNPSGGPQQVDMLFTDSLLKADFHKLDIRLLADAETTLDEGPFHQGKAHVIRLLARKPL